MIYNSTVFRSANCDALSYMASGSAHCLNFGTLRYSAYSFMSPWLNYSITVDIYVYDSSNLMSCYRYDDDIQDYTGIRFVLDNENQELNYNNQILMSVVGVRTTYIFPNTIVLLLGFLASLVTIRIPDLTTVNTIFPKHQFCCTSQHVLDNLLPDGRSINGFL